MRVIAGKFKGRRLHCPPGLAVRPTGDPVKETLFNLLADEVEEARVLDLFAGVGALGIEALSRGAGSAVFIEKEAAAEKFLKRNLETLGVGEEAVVVPGDVFRRARILSDARERFDIVFADPPYARGYVSRLMALLEERPLCSAGATLVLQHQEREPPHSEAAGLKLYRTREFGDTVLSLFHAE